MIDEENAMHYKNAHTLWVDGGCKMGAARDRMVSYWDKLPKKLMWREWGREINYPLDDVFIDPTDFLRDYAEMKRVKASGDIEAAKQLRGELVVPWVGMDKIEACLLAERLSEKKT